MISVAAAVLPWTPKATALLPPCCKTIVASVIGMITIKDGRVEQSNFHDYPMVRLAGAPKAESIIMPSGGFWGGVGEPPPALEAPALCNAIFAATGKRIRALPLKTADLQRA